MYIICLFIYKQNISYCYFFLNIYAALGILRAFFVKYLDPPEIYDLEMQLHSTPIPIPVEAVVSEHPAIFISDLEAGTSVVEEDEDDYMTVDDEEEEEEEVVEEEEAAEGKLITAILYTYSLLVLALYFLLIKLLYSRIPH